LLEGYGWVEESSLVAVETLASVECKGMISGEVQLWEEREQQGLLALANLESSQKQDYLSNRSSEVISGS
jgi:hypothetical protein